jgi:hypothetical protein
MRTIIIAFAAIAALSSSAFAIGGVCPKPMNGQEYKGKCVYQISRNENDQENARAESKAARERAHAAEAAAGKAAHDAAKAK